MGRLAGIDWLFAAIGLFGPLALALFLWASRDRERLYAPDTNKHPRWNFEQKSTSLEFVGEESPT